MHVTRVTALARAPLLMPARDTRGSQAPGHTENGAALNGAARLWTARTGADGRTDGRADARTGAARDSPILSSFRPCRARSQRDAGVEVFEQFYDRYSPTAGPPGRRGPGLAYALAL